MTTRLSFFDPALIERWGAAFIREDKIDEALSRLIPNVRITKGRFSCPGTAEQRDLVWNHMDQNHRPYIHRTYGDAMRVFIGKEAAFSLTRFGNWPVLIPVFDGHHKDNGFYQILCLFGVVLIVCIIECNADDAGETRMDIDWAIASHRLLRFLHGPLNRRLLRLNEVQNREDDQMRARRVELRASGYRFATDAPDFVKSNAVANNVIFPSLAAETTVPLDDLTQGVAHTVQLADRAYVVRREGAAVEVFPGVCPHEGAALAPEHIAGRVLKCPWHGLEFPPRRLAADGAAVTLCGARIELKGGKLSFRPQVAVPVNS